MKDLILISLNAQIVYVSDRIKSPTDRLYYLEQMKDLKQYIQMFDNYPVFLAVLENALSKIRPVTFSLNKEIKYKRLAVKHASDIVISIHNRFNGKLYAQS